jgi:Flp pilus assembly protein TadD
MNLIKPLLIALCLFPLGLIGQETKSDNPFSFDRVFYDCENQWVVFPKKSPAEPRFAYGFIYIDPSAGFTFDLKGTLMVDSNDRFVATPAPKTNVMKYRLEGNISKVAVLSEDRLKELSLPNEPDWLKAYKADHALVTTMVSWGKHYNHVGGFTQALNYLLKAYALAPHTAGLEFELSYNYNATGQFYKAMDVINAAIENDPKNFLYYRELGYMYLTTKRIEDAEKAYLKGIENCIDIREKSEMAYNVAYGYFMAGNKSKFAEWHEKTKGFITDPNSVFLKNLGGMNAKLNGG